MQSLEHQNTKETFIKNIVKQWPNELCELTKIARSEPQIQKLCLLGELLTKKIVEQDKDGSINKDEVKEVRKGIAKQKKKDQKEEIQQIFEGEQLGLC